MCVQSQTITRKQTDQPKCQLNQQRLRVTVSQCLRVIEDCNLTANHIRPGQICTSLIGIDGECSVRLHVLVLGYP